MTELSKKIAKRREARRKIYFREWRKQVYRELYLPPVPEEVPKKEEKLPEVDVEYKKLLAKITELHAEIDNLDSQLKRMGEKYKKTKDPDLLERIIETHRHREDLVARHNLLVQEFEKYKEKIIRTVIFSTVKTRDQEEKDLRKLEVHITLAGNKEHVTEQVLRDLMDTFLEANKNLDSLRWKIQEQKYGLTEWMIIHSKDEDMYVNLKYIDIDFPHNSWKETKSGKTLRHIEQAVEEMAHF